MRHRPQTRYALLFLWALALTPLRAAEAPLDYLQGLGSLHYHRLDSSVLKRGLHIYVREPGPVEWDGQGDLTTVYLLDGGGTLPVLAGQTHYLRLGEEIEPVLLVAISYGATTFKAGNWRSTDFTAPSDEREYWGGAATFQSMLRDELIPLVERMYPADPARRVIFGQSLGGQFVLFSALTDPRLFRAHIASNPALHRNLPFFLQWRGDSKPPVAASLLFVSSGSLEDEAFRAPTLAWVAHWNEQACAPWRLAFMTLEGQTHYSALAEAYTQGMRWIRKTLSALDAGGAAATPACAGR